ncbi:MAG: PmoA family protein [Rhodothermales bacterium]
MRLFVTSVFLAATIAACQSAASDSWRITLDAGNVDRVQSIVSFDPPAGLDAGSALVLVDDGGTTTPVQRHDDRLWFVLDRLDAHQTRTLTLRASASPAAGIAKQETEGAIAFSDAQGPILTYQSRPTPLPDPGFDPVFIRGGYIYPLFTPSGVLVVDDYPPNHLHHHGIWAAWTNTVFEGRTPDFWNMGDRKGTVEPVALDETWDGPVFGGARARNQYIDLTSGTRRPALDETWDVRVFHVDDGEHPYRLLEVRMHQTTATDSILTLPEYRYGGLGVRGHRQWDGEENAFFLTSEGLDRSNGHATHARWCHMGGYVDGQLAGIGMLAHPDNFRAPEPMRIHPTEPFFNWAPSQAGEWAITPDAPFDAAYRFVVSDGPPDAGLLDRLWQDWAEPVRVTVN